MTFRENPPEFETGIQMLFKKYNNDSLTNTITEAERKMFAWILDTYGPTTLTMNDGGGVTFRFHLPPDAVDYINARLAGLPAIPPVPEDSEVDWL